MNNNSLGVGEEAWEFWSEEVGQCPACAELENDDAFCARHDLEEEDVCAHFRALVRIERNS